MPIPIATHLMSVLRLTTAQGLDEPFNDNTETRTVVATGVRMQIGQPVGAMSRVGGGSENSVQFRFNADPSDITYLDWLRDESTNDVYRVVWTRLRVGLGLDHMEGAIEQVQGVAG